MQLLGRKPLPLQWKWSFVWGRRIQSWPDGVTGNHLAGKRNINSGDKEVYTWLSLCLWSAPSNEIFGIFILSSSSWFSVQLTSMSTTLNVWGRTEAYGWTILQGAYMQMNWNNSLRLKGLSRGAVWKLGVRFRGQNSFLLKFGYAPSQAEPALEFMAKSLEWLKKRREEWWEMDEQ